MKIRKRAKLRGLLATVMALAICVGLVPTTAFAASYSSVIINGQDLSQSGQERLMIGSGTASYDAESRTLTLDSITIEGAGSGYGLQLPEGEITIKLVGSNEIKNFQYGFYQGSDSSAEATDSITITGSGSLNISDCQAINNNAMSITITDAILTAKTTNGFTIHKELTIKDGAKVDIITTGTSGDVPATPIYLNGTLTVKDGTLTCSAEDFSPIDLVGVGCAPGLTLKNSTVTLNGPSNKFGIQLLYQRYDGDILIENSKIYVNTGSGIASLSSNDLVLKGKG